MNRLLDDDQRAKKEENKEVGEVLESFPKKV